MNQIMDGLLDTLEMYAGMAVSLGLNAFVIFSIVFFIVDGIKAKRQQRKRKAGLTVMFVIAMILMVLFLIAVGFLFFSIFYYVANS